MASPPFSTFDCTTQLGVIARLAEGALDPTVHVTDEGAKQHWAQHGLPKNTSHGHGANFLSTEWSLSFRFRDKDVVWDSVKYFAQVQVDYTSHSSLIPRNVTLS